MKRRKKKHWAKAKGNQLDELVFLVFPGKESLWRYLNRLEAAEDRLKLSSTPEPPALKAARSLAQFFGGVVDESP